jgi:hypothetical protein
MDLVDPWSAQPGHYHAYWERSDLQYRKYVSNNLIDLRSTFFPSYASPLCFQ